MTYKQLMNRIFEMTPEQQEMDVTVSMDLSEEAVPVKDVHVVLEDDVLGDVLDKNHPVLTVDF